MKKSIGLVREGYSIWERRCPFTPPQVEKIVRMGINVYIQPSGKRVFHDRQYEQAGAIVTEDLSNANTILGVKQVPKENLIPGKTYLFFSHTIKAQRDNMDLLDAIRDKKVRLIDYECITRGGVPGAPRLVAFGEYAGKAGMIDSIRGIGQQLLYKGISTPFLNVGSAYMYSSFMKAADTIKHAGNDFHEATIGQSVTFYNPLIFLFTGTGNVNRGAREVFNLLPHTWVNPKDFPSFIDSLRNKIETPIVGCQVDIQDMVIRKKDGGFDKKEFYTHPERYQSIFFDTFAKHSNVLVNGIYWDARYPRVVSKENLRTTQTENRRLHFIADISCDPNGGIESLSAATKVDSPFVSISDPPEAKDIMIMGCDILPSELPREASAHFGNHLLPFIDSLASNVTTDNLPPELRSACIADNGKLRDRFMYIEKLRYEKESK